VVDEATGRARSVETDAEGRFEATNLRPALPRRGRDDQLQEVRATGLVVRTGGVALVEAKLELGGVRETVTVSSDARQQPRHGEPSGHRRTRQPAAARPASNSRDMQDFLLLNRTCLGGSDDIQFLGGRTYGVSYVQDGQASTNAIFGTVGNSAPGLDAIGEIQVLSNSYSAEYGGLAGVVVTTKRGGNSYNGSAFYDYNSDGLNALTYNQKQSGAERNDPNADTHAHRWGASLGGPIAQNKTFFFANYEGSTQKEIYGGGRANVPTAAMRAGDFSGANFVIRDPLTGQPFPGNVIPAGRIDPTAQKMLNYFYPLPNLGTLSSGMGIYQQFVPETRDRHRADLRIDHEASKNDSFFLRASYQYRNPSSIQFESGSALTNLGIRDTKLTTATGVLGWTKILSPTMINEFRIGYNYDQSERQSHFLLAEANAAMGLETAPSLGPGQVGSRRSTSRAAPRRRARPTSRTADATRIARSSRTRSRSPTT
jgi:hypothetical protein